MMRSFATAVQNADIWVRDVANEMGTDDEQEAYRAMRAVLQTLRDRLPVEESAQLAAQLPTLIRGVYYEGYDPTGKPLKIRTANQFFRSVQSKSHGKPLLYPERATRAVLTVLWQHVTIGEIEDVLATLPEEIQDLLAPSFMHMMA